uniref:Uncharacterized protein n=1 Tax=Cacopsylla melanoneura TaxID=428564 RepID=A0A8D8UJE2_9HEMI
MRDKRVAFMEENLLGLNLHGRKLRRGRMGNLDRGDHFCHSITGSKCFFFLQLELVCCVPGNFSPSGTLHSMSPGAVTLHVSLGTTVPTVRYMFLPSTFPLYVSKHVATPTLYYSSYTLSLFPGRSVAVHLLFHTYLSYTYRFT